MNNKRLQYKNSGLLKSPPVYLLSNKEANKMLNMWHYLGSVRGILFAYGHNEGCLVFTNCRSRIYEKNYNNKNIKVIELARMVGKPNHKWSMSSLTCLVMKEIKKMKIYDIIVTYSDPYAGHNGKVYYSSGWIFDGKVLPDGHPLFFIDKKRISPRTLYDRHGTQSVNKMKEIYANRLELKAKPLKKRFIKILNKKMRLKKEDNKNNDKFINS
jgi:hypothetical protein